MSTIKDTTLAAIKNQLAIRNGYIKDFVDLYANKTWDVVQANVRAGAGKDLYNIGDELVCQYTLENDTFDFPWIIVENDAEVYWENDPNPHPAIILQAKYATVESLQFDAPEGVAVNQATESTAVDGWYYWGITETTYTKLELSAGDTIPFSSYDSVIKCAVDNLAIARYGYNRYSHSAYRQWLNSDADKGLWWESKHTGDVAPGQLNTYRGFMAGLDDDFLAVINPIKIQTSCNTVTDGGITDVLYDRFFLPSIEQMFGNPQADGIEGDYFPYWKTVMGVETRTNDANNGRICYAINAKSSARPVRLRSAYRGNSNHAWSVTSSGQVLTYSNGAGAALGCAPACAVS